MPKWLYKLVVAMGVTLSALTGLAAIGGMWLLRKRVLAEEQVEVAREQRQQPLFEVAPAPVPSGVPLLPPVQAGGVATVDRPGLRSLLLHQRHAELNRAFDAYQEAFEADAALEGQPMDASSTFGVAEAPLITPLDAWVEATPTHFAPYLARGAHLVSVAFARRGGKFVHETPKSDLDAMEATLARAQLDLDRALSLRPKLVAAQREQLFVHRARGDHRAGRATLDAALKSCPTCFRVCVTWAYSLQPRWGGSYTQITELAREMGARGVPGAKTLGGFLYVDRAQQQLRDEQLDEAAATIAHAFDYGEHADFYEQRAIVAVRRKRDAEALADLDRGLALAPGRPDLLVERARATMNLERFEEAGQSLLQALRANANASGARELRDYLVKLLAYHGWNAHKAGERARALSLLDLAAELAPGDPDIGRRRAWAVVGDTGGDPATPPAATGTNPPSAAAEQDFRSIQQRDYALARQGKFAEVVPMWDAYLQRHPDDARAYLERGGAYHHLGRHDDARADARRACELGLNEGCLRAR